MIVNNMVDEMDTSLLVLLKEWAIRLDAEEMIVNSDASVTLLCSDGYICNHYAPTIMELFESKEPIYMDLLEAYDREMRY